jgi:hypothetical protein
MSTASRSQTRTKATTTGRFFGINFLDIAADLRFCMERSAEKPLVPATTDILWVHAVARIYKYMDKKLPDDVYKALGKNNEVSNQRNFRYLYSCLPIGEKLCQVQRFAKGRQEAIGHLVPVDEKLKRAEVGGAAFADDLDLAHEKGFPAFGVFVPSSVPAIERVKAELEDAKLELEEGQGWLDFVAKQERQLHKVVKKYRSELKASTSTVQELAADVDRFLQQVLEMEWMPKSGGAKAAGPKVDDGSEEEVKDPKVGKSGDGSKVISPEGKNKKKRKNQSDPDESSKPSSSSDEEKKVDPDA